MKKPSLSQAQKLMYASEKGDNFRWVFKLLATCSPRALTVEDLAPIELHTELAELGGLYLLLRP